MNMKTFYSKALKYTAALLLCTATAGCTSFLDEKTYSFVSGDDLYTTAANAELPSRAYTTYSTQVRFREPATSPSGDAACTT